MLMEWWALAAVAVAYLVGVRTGPRLVGWIDRYAHDPGPRPYTRRELEAADCFRCGSPAAHQWQVCADGNTWRALCFACDVELNRTVLSWMGHPDQHRLMLEYVSDEARS